MKFTQLTLSILLILVSSCGVKEKSSEEISSAGSIECRSTLSTFHDTEIAGEMTFYDSCKKSQVVGNDELILDLVPDTYAFNIQNQNTLIITDKEFGDTLATLHNSEKSNSLFRIWTASETNENGIKCDYSYNISSDEIIISAKCNN